MDIQELKLKILAMMQKEPLKEYQIGHFLLIVSKDVSDLNNPSHPITLFKILSEMENEGQIENTNKIPKKFGTLIQRIQTSRWILK